MRFGPSLGLKKLSRLYSHNNGQAGRCSTPSHHCYHPMVTTNSSFDLIDAPSLSDAESAQKNSSAHRFSAPPKIDSGMFSGTTLTCLGLLSLLMIWAWRMWSSWATWGSPTIDCGREVYVPAMLAQGKTLYRDIWYLYFPAAPYFNSFLFRLFGTRLEVTYMAGSFAALGSAIFLYLSGVRLSSRLAGWIFGWTGRH